MLIWVVSVDFSQGETLGLGGIVSGQCVHHAIKDRHDGCSGTHRILKHLHRLEHMNHSQIRRDMNVELKSIKTKYPDTEAPKTAKALLKK